MYNGDSPAALAVPRITRPRASRRKNVSLFSSVVEHWSRKPGVVSSNLTGGMTLFFLFASSPHSRTSLSAWQQLARMCGAGKRSICISSASMQRAPDDVHHERERIMLIRDSAHVVGIIISAEFFAVARANRFCMDCYWYAAGSSSFVINNAS